MNKKGFTIIELLAVILVVSILLIIAVPTILKFMKKGTSAYYTSLESELKVAGADYVETYRSLLPQYIDHVRVISLEELVDNKYIDPVVDEKGNACTGQVAIKKIKQDSYEYYSCLRCGEYFVSKENNCNYTEYDNEYTDSGDYRIELERYSYDVNQTDTFIAPLAKLYYKDDPNPIKTDLKGSPEIVNTNQLGTYQIIYYYHGAKKIVTVNVKDTVKPSKPKVVLKYTNKNGKSYQEDWFSGDVYVSYKSTDYAKDTIKGSGVDHYEVSTDNVNFVALDAESQNNYKKLSANEQLMLRQGNYLRYVRAVDKSGNIGPSASYRIKIDKTKPTCSLEVKSGTKYGDWYNTNVTVGFKSTDGTVSDLKTSTVDTTSITSPMQSKKITGTVVDQAGNSNTCTITVSVDNVRPSNPTITASDSKASNTWHNTTSNFTLNYSIAGENLSGNIYYYMKNSPITVTNGRGNGTQTKTATISAETNYDEYYGLVCSGAGLCSDNSVYIVKYDKTKPLCNWFGESTEWISRGTRTIGVSCDDQDKSGCTTSTAIQTWGINTSVKTQTFTYVIQDNAGNSTTCSKTANVYIDTVAPTISAKQATINPGTSTTYDFKNNINTTCNGISGCTTSCNPATSAGIGEYDVICTIISNSNLAASTKFHVKH